MDLSTNKISQPDSLMNFIQKELSDKNFGRLTSLLSGETLNQSQKSNLVRNINQALEHLTIPFKGLALKLDLSSQSNLQKLEIETVQDDFTVMLPNRSDGEILLLSYLLMLRDFNSSKNSAPQIFLLDELEKSLDPSHQIILTQLISKIHVPNLHILYSTHSPFMFFDENIRQKSKLYKTVKEINITHISQDGYSNDFCLNYTSWAEMNYLAYDLISIEYHNELYGALSLDIGDIKKTDAFLHSQGADIRPYAKVNRAQEITPQQCPYSSTCTEHDNHTKSDKICSTLPTYIRNLTHHKENDKNDPFSQDELRASIKKMRELLTPADV